MADAATASEDKEGLTSGQQIPGLVTNQSRRQIATQSAAKPSPPQGTDVSESKMAVSSALMSSRKQVAAQNCLSLTARQCLQSPHCCYMRINGDESGKPQYQCREPANRCKQDFIQLSAAVVDTGKASCERKPGCRYIPGDCQYPDNGACNCQGKNPPRCEEK